MLYIVPYKVDVESKTRPYANYLIIAWILFAFFQQMTSPVHQIRPFVLDGWKLTGLFGYMWQHAGFLHLFGNLLFLWVFGNAVCSKIGNVLYPFVYIAGGLIAAIFYVLCDGGLAIGASGALNAIIGIYILLYPFNSISCCWVFIIFPFHRFSVSGFWVIIASFIINFVAGIIGFSNVTRIAYVMHVGGFLGGIAIGSFLLYLGLIKKDKDEDDRALLRQFRSDAAW